MADPDAIEIQVNQLVNDRQLFMAKQKYATLNITEFIEKMKAEYSYLYKSSNKLFEKVMAGDLDTPEGRAILNHIFKVKKNVTSSDDADKVFGKIMSDIYVKPLVDKLPAPNTDKS